VGISSRGGKLDLFLCLFFFAELRAPTAGHFPSIFGRGHDAGQKPAKVVVKASRQQHETTETAGTDGDDFNPNIKQRQSPGKRGLPIEF